MIIRVFLGYFLFQNIFCFCFWHILEKQKHSPVPRGPKWSFAKSRVYQKFGCRLLLRGKGSFILGIIDIILHGSEVLLVPYKNMQKKLLIDSTLAFDPPWTGLTGGGWLFGPILGNFVEIFCFYFCFCFCFQPFWGLKTCFSVTFFSFPPSCLHWMRYRFKTTYQNLLLDHNSHG